MTPPSKRESQSSPQNPSAPPNPPLAPALLPDPELLRHYGQLGEGVIQTILNEFVAYGTNHGELATNKQRFDYDLQKREQRIKLCGQVFAFIISVIAIAGGLWLAGSAHQPLTGGIITGGGVVAIVLAFLKSRNAAEPRH